MTRDTLESLYSLAQTATLPGTKITFPAEAALELLDFVEDLKEEIIELEAHINEIEAENEALQDDVDSLESELAIATGEAP